MTLNEVNIIKNSVLDATEAYVDARLSVADFAKTQIGVTEGEPTKVNKKYYHTVRCNAIKNVPDSGVVYRNVLAVGNTEFPAGSVVFLIAPNAQFSNQFILGKLDNTPINIVGGSIKIGGNDPDNNPVFSVSKDGVVRIKKGEITLGGTETAPSFRVDNDGNIYIKKGEINLGQTTGQGGTVKYDVNINKDGFNLGYVSATNDYNFSVTDKGVMTMKKGSITLSDKFKVDDSGWMAIGGTDSSNANFYVANTGKVTIKSGSISLGYNNTVQDYNFKISDTGTLNLGVTGTTPSNKSYNFSITDAGKVTIKSGEINLNYNTDYRKYGFIVDSTGIKLGATSVGYNFTVDTNGNVTIKEGTITMKSGSITLANKFKVDESGWLAIGGTDSNAPFYVANDGSVTMKKGSITIIGNGTAARPAFDVTTGGQVTIRRGSIRIGYKTTTEGVGGGDRYDVNISSGGFRLGYLNDTGSGTASSPRVPQYNFDVREDGTITIKKGSINLGLNSTDNKYNFSVTNSGVLFARSGTIAGFTINPNSLTTVGGTTYDTNARSELSSTTLRVSKWTGSTSGKRVSILMDVNNNNGRLVINGDNATAPYIGVSSLRGWANTSTGSFPDMMNTSSGNYVRITPTSIALKENNTDPSNEYTIGTEGFKFLWQGRNLGNLRITVSNSQVSFTNVDTNKSGFVTLI